MWNNIEVGEQRYQSTTNLEFQIQLQLKYQILMLLAHSTFVIIESPMLVIQGIVLSHFMHDITDSWKYNVHGHSHDLFLVGAITQPLALVCFLPITDAIRQGADPTGLLDHKWLNAFSHIRSKSTIFLCL